MDGGRWRKCLAAGVGLYSHGNTFLLADRRIKNQQRGQLPVGLAVAINCPEDSLMEAATSGG